MSPKHFSSLSILTVVAATLAVAGCGDDKDAATTSTPAAQTPPAAATTPAATTPAETPSTPAAGGQDPVALAVAATDRQDGGVAVALDGTVTSQGQELPLAGTGTIDRKAQRGSFTLKTSLGAQPFSIEEITDKQLLYIRSEVFAGKLPGGRSWMKIDLDAAAKERGIDLSALGTSGPAQSPTQGLDYLKGAGKAKKLGSEEVGGVATTHYRVTVNLDRAAKRSTQTSAKRAIDALSKSLGTRTSIPVDVWVDGENLVRRQRVDYVAMIDGEKTTFKLTTDYTDFGAAVKISPPADRETIDGVAVLKQAAKAKKEADAAKKQGAVTAQG
jgi:hypothetical protein